MSNVDWYEGIDGQIAVEGEYVWLLREGLSGEVTFPFDTRPRRVHRDQIVDIQLSPAAAFGIGSFHVRAEGVSPEQVVIGQKHFRDGLTFDARANEAFADLYRDLSPHFEKVEGDQRQGSSDTDPEVEQSPSPRRSTGPVQRAPNTSKAGPRRELSDIAAALEKLGGIASERELESVLGGSVRVDESSTDVRWRSFGGVRVATGGQHPLPKEKSANEMRLLRQLVDRLGPNPTTGEIKSAIRGSSLARFNLQRLAVVWQDIADAVARPLPPPTQVPRTDPSKTDATRPSATLSSGVQTSKASSLPKQADPPTQVTPPRAVLPPSPRPGPRKITLPGLKPSTKASPYSGNRLRITLDCGGHYPKALYDFATGSTEITLGEHAVLGKRFDSPNAAAAALYDHYLPGTPEPVDSSVLWRVDDGSGRTLHDVMK